MATKIPSSSAKRIIEKMRMEISALQKENVELKKQVDDLKTKI